MLEIVSEIDDDRFFERSAEKADLDLSGDHWKKAGDPYHDLDSRSSRNSMVFKLKNVGGKQLDLL